MGFGRPGCANVYSKTVTCHHQPVLRLIVLALGTLILVACGGPGPTAAASPSRASVIDTCLVGRWTSTGVVVRNGATVTASGGTGQVITFSSAGTMAVDDTHMQPLMLTSNGQHATEKFSGTSTGTVTTRGGRLSYKPAAGSTESFSLFDPVGSPVGTPSVDTGLETSYMCTPGTSFGLNEGGGIGLIYALG